MEKYIKAWKVEAVDVAYAQMISLEEYQRWNAANQFNGPCSIQTENCELYLIQHMYAQRSNIEDQLIQHIIDPNHLLVNNRARFCSKGMRRVGIN